MKTFTYNRLQKALSGECAAEGEILLPDYCPTVMKILSAEATAFLKTETVRSDRAYAEGTAELRILYLSDTEEGLQNVTHRLPFAYSVALEKTGEDAFVDTDVNIEYKQVRALSPRKLYAKVTLSVKTDVYTKETLTFPDEEKTEKTELLRENRELSYPLETLTKTLKFNESLEGGQLDLEKLLRCEAEFFETERKPVNKKLIVKADLRLSLTYLSSKGEIGHYEKRFPVSQLLELPEGENGNEAFVAFSLSDLSLSLTKKGEQTYIDCEGEALIKISCLKKEKLSLITDAFSLTEKADCVKEEVPLQKIYPVKEKLDFTEKVTADGFSSLCDVNVRPQLMTFLYDKEKKEAVGEGIFEVTLLYKDLENNFAAVEKALPFTLRTPLAEEAEKLRANCRLIITSLTKTPLPDGVELKIGALYVGSLTVLKSETAVTEITLTPTERKPARRLLACYGKRGERVWDYAKKYGVAPEKIKERNSLSSEVLEEDGMLFIAD